MQDAQNDKIIVSLTHNLFQHVRLTFPCNARARPPPPWPLANKNRSISHTLYRPQGSQCVEKEAAYSTKVA